MGVMKAPLQWKTKTEMIYHMLREAIISGEMKPGERIILRQIASDLGVSAIPVREAVKLLEAEGLVNFSAYSEITVSRFSVQDYRELFEVRLVLESYASKLAADQVNEEMIQELEQLLVEMRSCVEKEDYKTYGILNRSFHKTIDEYAGNSHLLKLIEQVNAKTDRARALFIFNPQRAKESLKGHEEIVKALVDGDKETVARVFKEQSATGFELFLKNNQESLLNEKDSDDKNSSNP